jgi:glycosyltransferase involved in cell wall biosynthesis
MYKVKIVSASQNSGHEVRGVGFYTSRLLSNLTPLAHDYGFEISKSVTHFDIVHYTYFDLFSHTLPIYKQSKTIVTIHDVVPLEFPDHYPSGFKGSLNFVLQKIALSNVDLVLTDSYASIQAIHKHLEIPYHKLKLIYLAADSIFKKIPKPNNKFHLPKKFVLYVGDINYNKNIPSLVAACNKINTPLVIVGKSAQEIEQLDLQHPELAHLNGIDLSNVIRVGFVSNDDLVNIYNLASVYCQPSFSEGYGLGIVEAMACGTPVACSDIPVFREIAEQSATYFNPNSIGEMSQAIKTAKVFNGQSQAAKFSWDKTARLTLQSYQEII